MIRIKLEWLQNVIAMDQRRMAKTVFECKPEVGRPTLRWLKCVENDMRGM
jgi:hypothetical protein